MNLRLGENYIRYKNSGTKNAIADRLPSFTGKSLQYSQAQLEKIAKNVDNVLGNDKFFSSKLASAGFESSADKVIIKDEGLLTSIFKTVKYPFVDMPLDIANWAANSLKKTPLKDVGDKISNVSVLQNRAAKLEKEKSQQVVQDLLTQYFPASDKLDIEKQTENFRRKVTSGITKTAKNYSSRDERTLNRMATSTVSAVYSGRDFYNISMLQKDDKEEAKKADKSRFKQEMTRMAFSAGLTFLTLGALDKYVKSNIVANSLVIALSALASEVGSRVLSHTPLRPLSSEDAAKIAQKKKAQNPEENKEVKAETSKEVNKTNQIGFKGAQVEEVFSQFAKDGSIASIDMLKGQKPAQQPAKAENTNKEELKKGSALKKLAFAAGASSAFYLLSKGAKGEYGAKMARKALYNTNQEKISDFVSGKTNSLSVDIQKTIKEIADKQNATADSVNLFDKFKKIVTTKKEVINLNELKASLKTLQGSKEGAQISSLIDEYISHIDSLIEGGSDTVTTSVERFLLPGIYNGVTKIFKTVYQILSTPGAAINALVNKTVFLNSEKAISDATKKSDIFGAQKLNKAYKKEIGSLKKLLDKNNNEKIVNQIKNSTRNFETGAETGELANLSRTMVTAISTYFFVNDYSNKVLIESAGQDVDKAREERNERIAHKLSNFVINGTLMNLFNSVFKTPLNESLIKASIIAAATETTNEFLVRKSICQPVGRKDSRQEIIDYEETQLNKKGIMGSWSRVFRKLTGKKTLTQKAGIDNKQQDKK